MHEHVSKGSASVQNPPRGHNYPFFHSLFHSQRISLVRYDDLTSSDHKSNNQLPSYPTLFPPMRHLLALYQSRPLPSNCSTTKVVWMRPRTFLQTRLLHQMQSFPFPFLPLLRAILALCRVLQWNHKVTHDLPPITLQLPQLPLLCGTLHLPLRFVIVGSKST